MPSMFGGDSTSEDYAPHMYINGEFVGNNLVEFRIGNIEYRIGVVEKSGQPKVVCEKGRWGSASKVMLVKDFTVKEKVKLLEFLCSDESENVDPEDQEVIRKAFHLPKKVLTKALSKKKEVRQRLDNFIKTVSGGREEVRSRKR